MQMQIKATEQITKLDGVECRVWHGTTAAGVECFVFVHRVAVRNDNDQTQCDRELREMPAPKPTPLDEVLR